MYVRTDYDHLRACRHSVGDTPGGWRIAARLRRSPPRSAETTQKPLRTDTRCCCCARLKLRASQNSPLRANAGHHAPNTYTTGRVYDTACASRRDTYLLLAQQLVDKNTHACTSGTPPPPRGSEVSRLGCVFLQRHHTPGGNRTNRRTTTDKTCMGPHTSRRVPAESRCANTVKDNVRKPKPRGIGTA